MPRQQAARQGQVFNPQIGVRPLNDSSRDTLADTDYSNIGPRVAVAWSPAFKNGFLGGLTGQRTVVRGGFGIVYDRVNTISVLLPAAFGIGFGQVLQTPAPFCNASGTPGAGCNPAAGAGDRAPVGVSHRGRRSDSHPAIHGRHVADRAGGPFRRHDLRHRSRAEASGATMRSTSPSSGRCPAG